MYGVWWWGNRYLGVYFCAKSYATDFTYVRKLVSVASFYRWKKHKAWGINFLKAAPVLWCSWNETNYKEPVIWYLLCIAVGIQKRSWGVLYLDLSEWGRVGVYSAFKSRKAPWRRRDSQLFFSTLPWVHALCQAPCQGLGTQSWRRQSPAGRGWLSLPGGQSQGRARVSKHPGGSEPWQKYLVVAWLGVKLAQVTLLKRRALIAEWRCWVKCKGKSSKSWL